ncbi:MAG TPA: class I SAM-dependent methyltransferase, partial [Bacteroidota bacterium]|nr:class I SAM-dependent methyltransferase [Bacteroidota bacterium]
SEKLRLFFQSLKERKLLARLVKSLRERGISTTILSGYSTIIEYLFDFRYGTDTMTWVELDDLDVDSEQKSHAVLYQPSPSAAIRRVLRALNFPHGKIFVDLGCGKGKVLLIASEFPFDEVRGIDFSERLCEIARENFLHYRMKGNTRSNVVIIHSDVLNYSIEDDEDVFYLFNPFDDYILQHVVDGIAESIRRRKRKIWIIYRNAQHKDTIVKALKPTQHFILSFYGQDFMIMEVEPEFVQNRVPEVLHKSSHA